MAKRGLCSGLFAALVAVAGASSGCQPEPERATSAASTLPSRPAVHTELHRRQLVARLGAVAASLSTGRSLPTLCRRAEDQSKALLVSESVIRALRDEPTPQEIPAHELGLNAGPFRVMLDGQRGEVPHEQLSEAINRIASHRYLAVVRVLDHRAPSRQGDRTITKGRMRGELILLDAEANEPLCRATITAETSDAMNAYGAHDAKAFADDLRVNFLRAVETQLSLATGGMKLAVGPRVNPRHLASHGASSPSASPP